MPRLTWLISRGCSRSTRGSSERESLRDSSREGSELRNRRGTKTCSNSTSPLLLSYHHLVQLLIILLNPLLRHTRLIASHGRRSSTSSATSLLSALQARITRHYQQQGDSHEAAHELASQELHWLRQAAQERAGGGATEDNWLKSLESMVADLVERDKPLAYILGEHALEALLFSVVC